MRRVHLFEFTDIAWWPQPLRRLTTDYLEAAASRTHLFDGILGPLEEAIRRSGSDRIVDLCSGSGGPVIAIVRKLRERGLPVQAVLTDLHPNSDLFSEVARRSQGTVTAIAEPIDALSPLPLSGFRTLFQSAHHFHPPQVRQILRSAVAQRDPIALFETTDRRWRALATMLLVPFSVLVLTLMVRPKAWWRFALTYLIPVAPVLIFWDALVSCLRSYPAEELLRMAYKLDAPGYRWMAGRTRGWLQVTYLIGYPPRSEGQ